MLLYFQRNERRERERRELERQQQSSWCKCTCSCYGDDKGDCEMCTEKKSLNGKPSTELKIENPNRDIITNKCNTHKGKLYYHFNKKILENVISRTWPQKLIQLF